MVVKVWLVVLVWVRVVVKEVGHQVIPGRVGSLVLLIVGVLGILATGVVIKGELWCELVLVVVGSVQVLAWWQEAAGENWHHREGSGGGVCGDPYLP